MTKAEFHVLLIAAAFSSARFGQQYISQSLIHDYRFHVSLNQSCDDELSEDEFIYPEDSGKIFPSISETEVVDLLWRDERCPEWIDVSVEALGTDYTLLSLLCCGRFTANRSKLYYSDRGFGPFGIKSPALPRDWKNGIKFKIRQA